MTTPIDRLAAAARRSPVRVGDSVMSESMGLGKAGVDKIVDVVPTAVRWLGLDALEALRVTSSLIGRVVTVIPRDATRGGWKTSQGGEVDVTSALDKRLKLSRTLTQVAIMARQWGGCYAWMVPQGEVGDLSKPLRPGPLAAIHPLAGRECIPLTWSLDPRSPSFTRPETFALAVSRPGVSFAQAVVHRSHLAYLPGLPLSPTAMGQPMLGYDLSAIQAYWDVVRDTEIGRRAMASGLVEQSMLWLQMRGGQALTAADQEEDARARLALFDDSRSTRGVAVTVGDDALARLEAPMSGMADSFRVLAEALAAVEGIPLTRLLGQTPGGLSTDDLSGQRSWAGVIATMREQYAGWLEQVYDVEFGPSDRDIVWPDVDPPSMSERAVTSSTLATRDAALVAAGIITPDEARSRLAGDEEVLLPVLGEDEPLPDLASVVEGLRTEGALP